MTVHSTFVKGAKVWVILKDGTKFSDYYVGKKSDHMTLRNHGKVLLKNIRSATLFRNQAI